MKIILERKEKDENKYTFGYFEKTDETMYSIWSDTLTAVIDNKDRFVVKTFNFSGFELQNLQNLPKEVYQMFHVYTEKANPELFI